MLDARYSRLARYAGLTDTLARWQAATCAVLGLGGLGGGLVLQLARLGVRRLVLIDRDTVSEENLGHQALYTQSDAQQALPKAIAAERVVLAVNPAVNVEAIAGELTPASIREQLADAELLFDGLDNYYARLLVNDYACATGKPYFYAGVVRGELSARAVIPGVTGCLRCLMPEPPAPGTAPLCAAEGVFPPLLGIANALQLDAANRYLAGSFSAADDELAALSLPEWRWQRVALHGPRAGCPVCTARCYDYLDAAGPALAEQACTGGRVQGEAGAGCDLAVLRRNLELDGSFIVRGNPYSVTASNGGVRYTVFASGRVVLEGSDDPTALRRFMATYIGI